MRRTARFAPILFSAILVLAMACGTAGPQQTAPSPNGQQENAGMGETTPDVQKDAAPVVASAPAGNTEQGGMDDGSATIDASNAPRHIFIPTDILGHEATWHPHLQIAKCNIPLASTDVCTLDKAYEVLDTEGNQLTTAGANQLWTGLSSTVALPWNTTNTEFAVGDSSTACSCVGMTDMQAASATKMNAADMTACSGTPIVCTGTFSPTPAVGEVYAFSGFGGAQAANINNTFELSAASVGSITLLHSTGGTITTAGGVAQKVNKYRQQANGTGSAVVTNNQIVYVATIGTTNANFVWNEWGMTTGAAATNTQSVPPPTLLNRAVVNLGTKTNASSWTATLTLTLS